MKKASATITLIKRYAAGDINERSHLYLEYSEYREEFMVIDLKEEQKSKMEFLSTRGLQTK